MARSNKPVVNDIRKVGTQSYRDLQALNAQKYQNAVSSLTSKYGSNAIPSFLPQTHSPLDYLWSGPVLSPILLNSNGMDYVGNSYWDLDSYTLSEFESMQNNPEEIRAINQPGIVLIASGVGKMLGLAGSTFLNSTVGLVSGATQGFANLAEGGSFWEGMWNNAVTAGLEEFNKSMEKWMPNYYTLAEKDAPWYENLFTANFIGDKILKNMGFTIGAIGAAALTGGFGVGSGITAGLTKLGLSAAKAGFIGGVANRVVNGLISAAGEASIEAYNSVHDGMENYNNELNKYYNTLALQLREKYLTDVDSGIAPLIAEQELNQGLKQLESNVNNAQQEYMKTATDNGNAVFGMNMAALTISNNLEFGRIMKGGWGTQSMLESAYKKGSKDVVRTIEGKVIGNTAADDVAFGKAMAKGTAKYQTVKTEEPSKWLWATGALKNGFTEGSEEGIQRIISDTNLMRSQAIALKEARRKGYIDYALDPNITDAMVNYSDALNHAWEESFGDASKSGWEEVALGALTGILGVPMIGRRKSGKMGLTWQGGFMEDYKEAKQERENTLKRVDALNSSIDSAKLRDRVHRAVADIAVNQQQRMALFEDDHVLFKHALVAGAVTTALNIRDHQDGGEAFKAMIEEMAMNADDKTVEEYKQAMAAEYGVDPKDLFAGKTTDDIKQDIQENFIKFNKLLGQTMENYDKLSTDKRIKGKIENYAFSELLHSYTLSQNIGERIHQIEERNAQLNPNDVLEKEELKDNEKDLAKLREDKKFFDQRVLNALENPSEFNKLVNTKMNNLVNSASLLSLKARVEELLNATTMELVALVLGLLSSEQREQVIALVYPKASNKTKNAIDNFNKFQDDVEVVREVINEMHRRNRNNIELLRQLSLDNANEQFGNMDNFESLMDYLKNLYVQRTRQAEGKDLNAEVTKEELELADERVLTDNEFLQEVLSDLLLQMNAAMQGLQTLTENVSGLLNTLQETIRIIDNLRNNLLLVNNLRSSQAEAEYSIANLLQNLYSDIVFRDSIGENTSIADSIRATIDTLENDTSVSPLIKQALLETLDSLNDNEKIQSVRDLIKLKKEEFAKKREQNKENKEKEKSKKKTKKKDSVDDSADTLDEEDEEISEGSMPEDVEIFENVSDLIDYINQKRREGEPKLIPSKNLLNLNIKIAISPNDGAYNEARSESNAFYTAITYLNDIHPKAVEKIANGTANKEMVDRVTEYIKTALKLIDLGYVVRDAFIDKVMTTINELLNDEIAQWYSNYKGADDNTEGTDAEPDNTTDATEENHEEQASSAGDYAGDQIHEVEMLNKPENRHKLHILDYRALKEMQTDGVRTQWLIDNVLGKVFAAKPDVTVRFLTTGKDIIYLGIKQEDVKDLIPNSNNISIVDTNDGRYVIIGTCGYMKDADNKPVNQSSWNKLKGRLQEGFDKKEDNNKFYVDTELHTNITNVTPGEFITITDDENHEVFRTVANLLLNANPHNLKPSDLTFLVVMGNEEDFVYTDFVNQKDGKSYRETDAQNTGGVYMYIPTGRADEMIPIMLRSVSWNDMFEGGLASVFTNSEYYKTTIGSRIDTLMNSTDNVEKIKAIGQLRDLLLFNKHKLDTGVSEAIRYNENDGTTLYLNDEGRWVTINNKEEFLDALQKLNPRISLNKVQLTNPKLYIDAGILLTNVKSLSTMKSTFYVRGLDDDLNLLEAQERNPDDYNFHPNDVKAVLYLDKKVYYHKADGIYDKNGNKLSDEEAQNVRELQSVIMTGLKYKMEGREYAISKDKKTVYLHENKSYIKLNEGMSRIIIKSYEKWLEEQEKKLNRDTLDSKDESSDKQLGNNLQTNRKEPKSDTVGKKQEELKVQSDERIKNVIYQLRDKYNSQYRKPLEESTVNSIINDLQNIEIQESMTTDTLNNEILKVFKKHNLAKVGYNLSAFISPSELRSAILQRNKEWDNTNLDDSENNDTNNKTLTLSEVQEKLRDFLIKEAIKFYEEVVQSPIESYVIDRYKQSSFKDLLLESRIRTILEEPEIRDRYNALSKQLMARTKQNGTNLDNPENNDNFAKVLDFVKSYRNAIMDDDTVFENTYKLLGITEEEADELNPDELAEKLTLKLVDKGVKAADITRWEDLIQAIDNALNC